MIVGVSFDTPADNKAFADREHFGFVLLSDVDRTVGQQYQVASADGQAAYAQRVAYLIDPDGIIREAYQVTDLPGFADQVVADLTSRQPF